MDIKATYQVHPEGTTVKCTAREFAKYLNNTDLMALLDKAAEDRSSVKETPATVSYDEQAVRQNIKMMLTFKARLKASQDEDPLTIDEEEISVENRPCP